MHPPGAFSESAITSKALEKSTKRTPQNILRERDGEMGVCVWGGGGVSNKQINLAETVNKSTFNAQPNMPVTSGSNRNG